MRKKELLLILSVFWMAACDTDHNAKNNVSYKSIPGPLAEGSSKICPNVDGTFTILGYSQKSPYDFDILILKVDRKGREIWRKIYGDLSYNQPADIITLNDGYMVLSSVSNGNDDVYLLRLNSEGDTIWTKTILYPGLQLCFAMTQTQNGDIMLCGESIPADGGYANAFYMLVNSVGDTLWTRTISSGFPFILRDVELTSDGGFIFVGSQYQNYEDGFVMKTDSSGQVLWQTSFDAGLFESFDRIKRVNSNEYIILGMHSGYSDTTAVIVRGIDVNGQLLSSTMIVYPFAMYPSALETLSDTTFLFTASTTQFGNFDCFLGLYSLSGILLGFNIFGAAGFDAGADVFVSGEEIVVIGSTTKRDPLGDVLFFTISFASLIATSG